MPTPPAVRASSRACPSRACRWRAADADRRAALRDLGRRRARDARRLGVRLGAAMRARVPAERTSGWCSWYEYFTRVDAGAIARNLAAAVDLRERSPSISSSSTTAIRRRSATGSPSTRSSRAVSRRSRTGSRRAASSPGSGSRRSSPDPSRAWHASIRAGSFATRSAGRVAASTTPPGAGSTLPGCSIRRTRARSSGSPRPARRSCASSAFAS
jgi:hypothetical protein